MSDVSIHLFDTIDRLDAGESAHTRRTLVEGAAASLASMGPLGDLAARQPRHRPPLRRGLRPHTHRPRREHHHDLLTAAVPRRRRRDPAGVPISRAVLVATAGCALVLAVTGRGEPSAASGTPPPAGLRYTLMQTNLCLSGMARCYGKVAYPAVVEETVARIRATRPDAVTVNEACRRDVAQLARRTGYHLRFSTVTSSAGPIRCIRPGGRGRFGDAVLTRAPVERSESHAFAAQAGRERRRWLCVSTGAHIDVCTAHLAMPSPVEAAGNEAQCAELAAILARRMATRAVLFGGDVNRLRPCAPAGLWTRTDGGARQAPSLQHVYGSGALRSPSAHVLPATHTDHDVLLIRAHPVALRAPG